jgi:di/tricarboxylate transporter
VIGVRRARTALADPTDESLHSGDALLVVGEWDRLVQLQSATHDFVVLNFPAEMKNVAPARRRAPVAIAILAGMVLLSAFQVVPVLTAVMMAALAAVATRCLTMDDAYRSIHWSSIILLAGMLPLADALDKTGGVELIVNGLVSGLGDSGPYALLSLLFWLTALLGLFLSNTATSVVMAPIAIQAAQALGVSPYPLAVAIVIAASAGFASPVSSPVVTLVVEPGRYRFIDFVKAGFPLMLLAYFIALVTIPLLFPFDG